MKGIPMKDWEVRALLANRKTVTRRVVKPQPICYGLNSTFEPHAKDFFLSAEKNCLRCRVCGNDPEYSREGSNVVHHWIPPYRPGDILYVRETWYYETFYEDTDNAPDLPTGNRSWRYVYKADKPDYPVIPGHWRPSIHMPREAARIFLRVTDVRVERLQEITVDDVLREGIQEIEPPPICRKEPHYPESFPRGFDGWNKQRQNDWIQSEARARYIGWLEYADNLLKKFSNHWDSTIKPADRALYGWDANPWVRAIEFERISREEAEHGETGIGQA